MRDCPQAQQNTHPRRELELPANNRRVPSVFRRSGGGEGPLRASGELLLRLSSASSSTSLSSSRSSSPSSPVTPCSVSGVTAHATVAVCAFMWASSLRRDRGEERPHSVALQGWLAMWDVYYCNISKRRSRQLCDKYITLLLLPYSHHINWCREK